MAGKIVTAGTFSFDDIQDLGDEIICEKSNFDLTTTSGDNFDSIEGFRDTIVMFQCVTEQTITGTATVDMRAAHSFFQGTTSWASRTLVSQSSITTISAGGASLDLMDPAVKDLADMMFAIASPYQQSGRGSAQAIVHGAGEFFPRFSGTPTAGKISFRFHLIDASARPWLAGI